MKTMSALLGLLVIGLLGLGYLYVSGPTSGTILQPSQPSGKSYGTTASLSVQVEDPYNASLVDANAELWSISGERRVAETSIPAALTSMATNLDNSFSGFIMSGNDNYESTTDRGMEYYYTKEPISWEGQGLQTFKTKTYREETGTGTTIWTFYDDNSAETTANISIASGGTYTDAEIKLESQKNLCLGNPSLDNEVQESIAVCFNESTAGNHEKIELEGKQELSGYPKFLRGMNIVSCWEWTDALCDSDSADAGLYIQLASGKSASAAGTDTISAILLDLAYYKNDNKDWVVGYGDDSSLTTSTDVGIDSITAALTIYETGI